jgi:hypothetical protein
MQTGKQNTAKLLGAFLEVHWLDGKNLSQIVIKVTEGHTR